ncbi:glutaredoxin family protein [Tautonia rosea]|uniref:glutaredoxin family protein n=1 Tax=Tautonia rosea TaxID=2728037 RepID=UPI001F39ECAA|nr:glutaredoxin family protein [Tautonia rosea]
MSMLLNFLRLWKAPRADHLRVTIYTRAECSCCETAKAVIEPRRRKHGFLVEEIDIDTDPELVEAYGTLVPVVAIDGKVRFRGKVEPILLDRLLRVEANRLHQQKPMR